MIQKTSNHFEQLAFVAFVALGSNLGQREHYLRAALLELERLPFVKHLRSSSIYETPPYLASGDAYLNAVCCFELENRAIEPELFLSFLLEIEQRWGRDRSNPNLNPDQINAPRTLDLDLLWWAGQERSSDFLTLPHPRMLQRSFVVHPLAELGVLSECCELDQQAVLAQAQPNQIQKRIDLSGFVAHWLV
jgi:2-amino-4-hydroxy-6-hydroxymethyldihydropteridine diphosphokinase